jgi:membrane dipeptidase
MPISIYPDGGEQTMTETEAAREQTDQAWALHERSNVIDGLDVSLMSEEHFLDARRGGVTAANCTVTFHHNFRETIELIQEFERKFEDFSYLIRPVRTVADIETVKREGRFGVIYGFQNTSPIENDVRLLRVFHALGVRIVQLTYMTANLSGDGCLEPRDGGLTLFGKAVIKELNRLGILIDLSHCGDRTSLEAIEASETPVAFTHACCQALASSPRNKSDDLIRALAERGGVMGITSLANFVSDDEAAADLDRYLDHLEHVIDLVGIDHVGPAMDFTQFQPDGFLRPVKWGGSQVPADDPWLLARSWPIRYATDIDDPTKFPNVTRGLLARGYSEADVQKIVGGNFLRLFREIWGG